MPDKTQHELALELQKLARQAAKALRENRPPDQVADINFHIDVHSTQQHVKASGQWDGPWVDESFLSPNWQQ